MAALETPIVQTGWKAPDFRLLSVNGKYYNILDLKGKKGTVVVFICNHCPYVQAIAYKLQRDAEDLSKLGVSVIAINSNDTEAYPEDSYSKMKEFAKKYNFSFQYLIDPTQEVARLYDAVCTPDFFGFNQNLELQYRGRLDSARKEMVPDAIRELYHAMKDVAEYGRCSKEQIPSIGCSIKWKITNAEKGE